MLVAPQISEGGSIRGCHKSCEVVFKAEHLSAVGDGMTGRHLYSRPFASIRGCIKVVSIRGLCSIFTNHSLRWE
jgi:hypothetical protein